MPAALDGLSAAGRRLDPHWPWLAPLLLTPFVIRYLGYVYGGPTHTIFLPWILHQANPGHLANDWFVNTVPHHRNSVLFLAWASQFLSLPAAVFLIHILAVFLFLWVAYRICAVLFENPLVFYLGVFLLLRWGYGGIGGADLLTAELNQHKAAIPVCLLAFYLALQKKHRWSALTAAAATWIHIQLGALTMLLLGVGMLASRRGAGLRTPALASAIYLLVAAPTILEQWLRYMMGPAPMTAAEYFEIHGLMAHPRHIVPSAFPIWEYFAFFVVLPIAAAFRGWRREPHRTVCIWCATILALCIAGTVFVEWRPVKLIIRLQTFRMTAFVRFFAVLYAAQVLLQAVEQKGFLKKAVALWAMAASRPAMIAISAPAIFGAQWSRWRHAGWGLSIALAAVVLSQSFNLFALEGFGRMLAARPEALAAGVVTSAVLAAVFRLPRKLTPTVLMALLFLSGWYWGLPFFRYDGVPETGYQQFCRAVKSQTPSGAVFINPPYELGFQFFAERAEIANWKCRPLREQDMAEWQRRLSGLAGEDDLRCAGWWDCRAAMRAGYVRLTATELLRLARKYGAQYVIRPQEHPLEFPEVLREGGYVLYEVPAARARSSP